MIVSGHRRRAALELLAKEEPERWSEVACIVEADAVSPALQQLRLIFANSGTRKLSSADMNEQATQVEKLLYQLQEEGHEFPGRMRDHVAKVMQTTNTKLATLKKIREHLAPCWKPAYKKGELAESTAYELSKLDVEDQQLIFDVKKSTGKNIRWMYAEDVKLYAKHFKAIRKVKCDRRGRPCDCQNIASKMKRACGLNSWEQLRCSKCCADCPDLASCKYACPVMADKIKKLRADKREASRQAKLEQEAKERPPILRLQELWLRFGLAREQAGVSILQSCTAAQRYYSKESERRIREFENNAREFKVNQTEVPYGFSYDLNYINALCALANLFDCSVDYLLCRTDDPKPIPATPEAVVPAAWNTGDPVNIGEYVVLALFEGSHKLRPFILNWNGDEWLNAGIPIAECGVEAVRWAEMPEVE